MEQALFGLLGVIVGGVLTGLGPYVLATRAERRQARASARLLEAELRAIVIPLRVSDLTADDSKDIPRYDELWLKARKWMPAPRLWEAHRATLAEVLNPTEWNSLSRAYEAVAALRGINPKVLLTPDGRLAHPWIRQQLSEFVDDIQRGAEVISRLAGSGRAPDSEPVMREYLVSAGER